MRNSFAVYVWAFLSLFLFLTSADAQNFLRTINVAGDGASSAPPDLATINTGVTTMAKTAAAALSGNTKKFERVLKVLKTKGIEDKDVQTTYFDVSPQFSRRKGGRQGNIIGYLVSNEVQVKVRDLDILGEVLDALVTAGSNSISGVNFSLEDAEMATIEARELAVADAKGRAQLYAKTAGVKLGKVLTISESAIQAPQAQADNFGDSEFLSRRRPRRARAPVASGELDVQVTVYVLFELLG